MHEANPLHRVTDDLLRVLILITIVFFLCMLVCLLLSPNVFDCVYWFVFGLLDWHGANVASHLWLRKWRGHASSWSDQILQKTTPCQILSDFCDCYLSVAKFHSVSTFINFFCDCYLSFAKDHLVVNSNRLFVIAICHLQKIILCQSLSDFLWLPSVISCHILSNFSWLLFVTWPRFDLTGIPTIRGVIVRFRADISVMCYHHFDFWGSGHRNRMLKCKSNTIL